MSANEAAAHVPVLLQEVCQALGSLEDRTVVDGTFGAGGYTRAFLEAGARVLAFDRDPSALARGEALKSEHGDRLTLIEAPFSELEAALAAHAVSSVDAVVLDVGVSSMQLDQAERGFAFRHDGPLDMRMGHDGPTAADLVNSCSEAELADIFFTYGEERRSRAIARLIVDVRDEWPIRTTRGLATLIERLMPQRRRDGVPAIHPATRVFQALRIAVNDELGELARVLAAAEALLLPGGHLAVVTFHSLEDRIVKRFVSDATGGPAPSRHLPETRGRRATFEAVSRRPIVPGDEEMAANPRARSAKLRVARRTDAPARAKTDILNDDGAALGVPLPKVWGGLPGAFGEGSRSQKRPGGKHARL